MLAVAGQVQQGSPSLQPEQRLACEPREVSDAAVHASRGVHPVREHVLVVERLGPELPRLDVVPPRLVRLRGGRGPASHARGLHPERAKDPALEQALVGLAGRGFGDQADDRPAHVRVDVLRARARDGWKPQGDPGHLPALTGRVAVLAGTSCQSLFTTAGSSPLVSCMGRIPARLSSRSWSVTRRYSSRIGRSPSADSSVVS